LPEFSLRKIEAAMSGYAVLLRRTVADSDKTLSIHARKQS